MTFGRKYKSNIYSVSLTHLYSLCSACLYWQQAHGLFPANHPLATHITMFVDVIKGQGTPEQVEKWGLAAENCNIIGTYAQTELAHGTNVRGIQTRADYDIRRGEFVLNTPSLEAYKWWPGGCMYCILLLLDYY